MMKAIIGQEAETLEKQHERFEEGPERWELPRGNVGQTREDEK